jgi:hypothetical protein
MFKYSKRISLAFLAILIGDFIYHDSETFIRWNMKRLIRRGDSVNQGQSFLSPSILFPREGARSLPPVGELPVLLYGPSGSGKSTALLEFAKSLKATKSPVVFVNIREVQDNDDKTENSAESKLKNVAIRICDRISFPYRRSFLWEVMSSSTFGGERFGIRFNGSSVFHRDYRVADTALDFLFKCLAELATEVDWMGNPIVNSTPVVIIDEAYDLIKDKGLASAGGKELFKRLGLLLTMYCVDEKKIHAFVASSSYQMVSQFSLLTTLRGTKSRAYELSDIEPALIIARLQGRGYSEIDATRILDVVGPRLRLLSGPLQLNPRPEVQAWEHQQVKTVASDFTSTLISIDKEYRSQLIKLLDDLVQNRSVLYEGDKVNLCNKFDLSRVLYIPGQTIGFQSRLHKNYWTKNCNTLKEEFSR